MLRRQLALAEDEAARANGQLSSETMEGLGRLSRIIELEERYQPPKVSHLSVALLLAATLAITSVLLFNHVRHTEISLEASVLEVGFTVTANHLLIDAIRLDDLGVSGVHSVEMPFQLAPAPIRSLRLKTPNPGPSHGELTLEPLLAASGARIVLSSVGPSRWRISLGGKPIEFHAGVSGSVHIDPANSTPAFASPKDFTFSGGPEAVDLDLLLHGAATQPFAAHLPVADLSLFRVEESHDQTDTLIDRVSAISEGSLYLSALDDREYKLRPGQPLELVGAHGVLRKLTFDNGKISLRFEGSVHDIETGGGEGFRSLMPTYLEWARARHGATLLWGSALYLFGITMTVLRWLGFVK